MAANTSFAQQIQIICHEYMEAWLYHFGQPEPDKEAYCDLFGMAMAQFVMDFIRQLDRVAAEAGEPGLGDRRTEGGNLISRVELREAASLPQPRRTSSRSSSRSSSSAAPRRSAPPGQRELIATKLAQAARSAGLRVRQPPPPHNSGP